MSGLLIVNPYATGVSEELVEAMLAGDEPRALEIGGRLEAGPPSAARLLRVRNDEKHEEAADPKGGQGKDNFI